MLVFLWLSILLGERELEIVFIIYKLAVDFVDVCICVFLSLFRGKLKYLYDWLNF